jgi:VanZ family protein
MLVKIATVLAWVCMTFIAYATLSPIGLRPTVASQGLEHFAAYAALGFLLCWAYPRSIVAVCFIVLSLAVGLELLQFVTPDRHASLLDAVTKAFGGLSGIATTWLVARLFRAPQLMRR